MHRGGQTHFHFFEIKLANLKNIPYICTVIENAQKGQSPL